MITKKYKTCTKCDKRLLIIKFHTYTDRRNGKTYCQSWCKKCINKYKKEYYIDNRGKIDKMNKKWRDENPNKVRTIQRRRNLKFRYNMTEDEYNDKLKKQYGRCAICKKQPSRTGRCSKRLVLDHCHKTGKNRGLLCIKCNTDVGLIENKSHMKKIIGYLKRYE